ncbi:MAG: type II toxin-antitoxin system VapC family toxin [Chloroflexi bacterium]|nr:type II toxin-antitoxin system VapC family toxin [Chloroflexota bacterium]
MLLDTHTLLWVRLGGGRLGRQARRAIDRAVQARDVAVSAISFWELGMLQEKGRLAVLQDIASWREELLEAGLVEISVTGIIAARAGVLPDLHGDPADRIIIATALEGHRLVTSDRRILDWPGNLNRLDATA